MPDRAYDIVLFGATGFAGRLTAEYLARHAPADCRWALAGRNVGKLENVRAQLAAIDPALSTLQLLDADSSDPAALRAIADDARVIASTVGPYIVHGEPLVAACAEAGTDYLDLTGEPEFVDTMYVRYHERAQRSGARLVHACGFDSIPHDIGAYYTVLQLARGRAAHRPRLRRGVGTAVRRHRAFGDHRVLAIPGAHRRSARAQAGRAGADGTIGARRRRPPAPRRGDRRLGACRCRRSTRRSSAGRRARWIGTARTSATRTARPSRICGRPPGWPPGVGGLVALAQMPPARNALLKRMPQGDGPSAQQRARSWFRVTFVGEGGGQRVVTRVSGGDPGYDETARMLGEAALALAFDDLPATLRSGHHRHRDGRRAARPAAEVRDAVRGARVVLVS